MAKPKTKNTRALLALKRRKMIAAARQIPKGELRILPLATAAGVSTLTARKWLVEAKIDVSHCKRGRPKAGESVGFEGVEALLQATMRVGQANVDFADQMNGGSDDAE